MAIMASGNITVNFRSTEDGIQKAMSFIERAQEVCEDSDLRKRNDALEIIDDYLTVAKASLICCGEDMVKKVHDNAEKVKLMKDREYENNKNK